MLVCVVVITLTMNQQPAERAYQYDPAGLKEISYHRSGIDLRPAGRTTTIRFEQSWQLNIALEASGASCNILAQSLLDGSSLAVLSRKHGSFVQSASHWEVPFVMWILHWLIIILTHMSRQRKGYLSVCCHNQSIIIHSNT